MTLPESIPAGVLDADVKGWGLPDEWSKIIIYRGQVIAYDKHFLRCATIPVTHPRPDGIYQVKSDYYTNYLACVDGKFFNGNGTEIFKWQLEGCEVGPRIGDIPGATND